MSTPTKFPAWLSRQFAKIRSPIFHFFLVAAIVGVLSNAVASELKDAYDAQTGRRQGATPFGWPSVFCITLYAIFVGYLYHLRSAVTRPKDRLIQYIEPPPRQHLIMFLSSVDTERNSKGYPDALALTFKLKDDLALMVEKKKDRVSTPWEMILRGMAHNRSRLKTVTFLASQGKAGSIGCFHLCHKFLRSYEEFKGVKIRLFVQENPQPRLMSFEGGGGTGPLEDGGWNFEDFNQLVLALDRLITRIKAEEELINEHEIVVDITGGQKPTSIAGTAVTINRDTTVQYVQTNELNVVGYDCILHSGDTEGIA